MILESLGKSDTSYIEKKWDDAILTKRLENLKKIIPAIEVDSAINRYKSMADNEYDAKMLAYYFLRRKHCKINSSVFGKQKQVKYNTKPPQITSYTINGSNGWYVTSSTNTCTYTNYTTDYTFTPYTYSVTTASW
jgi:hypothetical protein